MARFCSIRTWFAATLVAVSLLTAGAIALYVVPTTDDQYRDLAQDAALGVTARAAHDVSDASTSAGVHRALARASRNGQLSLWLVDKRGKVVSASALPSVSLRGLPDVSRAISVALARGRFVPTGEGTASHVVALPARTRNGAPAALVAYAPRAGFAERASDALRRRFILGTLIAMTLAIVVSLAVATLVSRRVRRLAVAARTIAGGDFNEPVNDRFPDDIGRLAESIDEMRERLAVAFAVVERERGSLSAVLNRLEEGVIALDPTGLVEIVNPAASELLGVDDRARPALEPWPAAVLVGNAGAAPALRGRDRDASRTLAACATRRFTRRRRPRIEPRRRFRPNCRAEPRSIGAALPRERSHELRTPLAAIVAAVEVLRGRREGRGRGARRVPHRSPARGAPPSALDRSPADRRSNGLRDPRALAAACRSRIAPGIHR